MPICNRMEYKDMWLPNFMEQESLSMLILIKDFSRNFWENNICELKV